MENKKVESSLIRLYGNADYDNDGDDFAKIIAYITGLERENFGLRQQVTNLREKDEKRWL